MVKSSSTLGYCFRCARKDGGQPFGNTAHITSQSKQNHITFYYRLFKVVRAYVGLIVWTAAFSPHAWIRRFLGPITSYTVYSAELWSISLMSSILGFRQDAIKGKLVVCIHNQAAIEAVANPGASSGPIHRQMDDMAYSSPQRKKAQTWSCTRYRLIGVLKETTRPT